MALELSTIGVTVKYATEATAGTKPSTFSTEITNITSIGEISAEPEQLEVTDLKDTWRRYIDGLKSGAENVTLGVNLTSAFKTLWETLVTAATTAKAANKATWFQVTVPSFGSFEFAGIPSDIGLPEIGVGEVFDGEVSITVNQISGWAS